MTQPPDPGIDPAHMDRAIDLAQRAEGQTSPNPMVGAVLVRGGRVLGEGWHQKAGSPHAEIEAISDAKKNGHSPQGATLYVTLEPCSTHGRTPPCTDAIITAGIAHVVVAATDPNPAHAGRAWEILRQAGIQLTTGVLADRAEALNEIFNHWIVHTSPFITLKLALTLDGKIAAADGNSRWITGIEARKVGQRLRQQHDAILVGVGTILADDPELSLRSPTNETLGCRTRIVLDTQARTPADARVIRDVFRKSTILCVGENAPSERVDALSQWVTVERIPVQDGHLDLPAVVQRMAGRGIASILVEGGGTVAAAFLEGGLVQRTAFFYAPMVLGGSGAHPAVAGKGWNDLAQVPALRDIEWRRVNADLFVTARVSCSLI